MKIISDILKNWKVEKKRKSRAKERVALMDAIAGQMSEYSQSQFYALEKAFNYYLTHRRDLADIESAKILEKFDPKSLNREIKVTDLVSFRENINLFMFKVMEGELESTPYRTYTQSSNGYLENVLHVLVKDVDKITRAEKGYYSLPHLICVWRRKIKEGIDDS